MSVVSSAPASWERQQNQGKEMDLKEYFATEPGGAIKEMAMWLGVTPTWMSLLIHGHRVPSAKLALEIEKATQGLVKKNVLRPDIFVVE